jgi:hypothetical protein
MDGQLTATAAVSVVAAAAALQAAALSVNETYIACNTGNCSMHRVPRTITQNPSFTVTAVLNGARKHAATRRALHV